MYLSRLVEQLYRLVQNPDTEELTENVYYQYGLEGIEYIAQHVLLPKLLMHAKVVGTLAFEITAPNDFMREIHNVKFDGIPVLAFNSTEAARRVDKEGLIINGHQLKITGRESLPKEITYGYYRQPIANRRMVELEDIFPIGFSENLVRAYILSKVYKWIEDYQEGEMGNTRFHESQFQQLLSELDMCIRTGQNWRLPVRGSSWL